VHATAIRLMIIAATAAALVGCGRSEPKKPAAANPPAQAQQPEFNKLDRSHKETPAPDTALANGDRQQTTQQEIADGKPLLLNLSASWSATSVKELPTLDKLSQTPGVAVQVAAVSQDSGPHASVEAFLTSHKIANLEAYQDKDMHLSGALNAQVLPTSVLFDAKGKEVWRYVGDRDWTSPESAKLLAEAGPRR
jgi:thiol-disulfide isomerase/thioredoxin